MQNAKTPNIFQPSSRIVNSICGLIYCVTVILDFYFTLHVPKHSIFWNYVTTGCSDSIKGKMEKKNSEKGLVNSNYITYRIETHSFYIPIDIFCFFCTWHASVHCTLLFCLHVAYAIRCYQRGSTALLYKISNSTQIQINSH